MNHQILNPINFFLYLLHEEDANVQRHLFLNKFFHLFIYFNGLSLI